MFIRSFPGMYAMRYPHFSGEPDAGGEDLSHFEEQPGDREPDSGAPAPAAEEGAEGDADEGASDGDEGAADNDGEPEGEGAAEGAAEGAEGGEGEEDDEDEPKPRKTDWRDRQIIKARKAEKDARDEAARLAKENADLKALSETTDPDERVKALVDKAREDGRTEALTQARSEGYAEKINKAADAMFDVGQKAFPKSWETRVSQAADIFSDELRARPDFLEAVTDLDNSAAVYHELAGDPDEMERVLQLAPHKMGIELAKLSTKLATKAPVRVSKAPAPIVPLNKNAVEPLALDDPNISQEEFNRRMDAEEEKAAKARR